MYSVVADVAKYQEFVPWCMNSTVLSETVSGTGGGAAV